MNSVFPLPPYLQNLGFHENPFPVTPDENGIFFSPKLAEQFSELQHFIELRRGFMLITGDVGVGKTTLSRLLLSRLETEGVQTALVFNTFLQGLELLKAINRDFGISTEGSSAETLLQSLNSWLLEQHEQGKNCVLIIDDAQGLSVDSLELVRLLSNLEASQVKLLQIVMVAQPEIGHTLARHDLRQLASRIALRLELTPLSLQELDQYLHHRLQRAGNPAAFRIDNKALQLLAQFSGGYIRRLHLLMDRCLFGLIATNTRRITPRLVQSSAEELQLEKNGHAHSNASSYRGRTGLILTVLCLALGTLAMTTPDFVMLSGKTLFTELLAPALTTAEPDRPIQQPATDIANTRWHAFTAAYPELVWSDSAPSDWSEAMSTLPLSGDRQNWTPILLAQELETDCQGQPAYPLPEGNLALFKTGLPTEALAFGSYTPATQTLQQALTTAGFLSADAVDGFMGPRTAAALARFQKLNALTPSGQPDIGTAYLLSCMQREGAE